MSEERETNWDLLKKQNWEQIRDDMLNYVDKFDSKKSNKEKLLFLICKVTGIEFKDIEISQNEKDLDEKYNHLNYKMTLHTDLARPDMGICGKYIYKFQFGLYYRTPITTDNEKVILSFCPSLGFKLMSGGSNGFETKSWFYYDVERKEWRLE